ncbi:MAG: helix-turn-helix domain-containing protein [Spirochaetales bacterium]|nr:helix-turn-helix domain-containing protein [Spirochaetales bacterium]
MTIKKELAQRLIKRAAEHVDVNINIMNDSGIIIASRENSRIGQFHQAAYNILHDHRDAEFVENTSPMPQGTKPGINLPIMYQDSRIGVVGITGDPAEIRDLAYVVKTAVETMVEYELYKEEHARRLDRKNYFLNQMIDPQADASHLNGLAGKMGYSDRYVRVPVLMRMPREDQIHDAERAVKQSEFHTKQHMTFITLDKDLLIFIPLPQKSSGQHFSRGREHIAAYVEGVEQAFSKAGLEKPECYFTGSFQRNFSDYHAAYSHLMWLLHAVPNEHDKITFFSDHVLSYALQAIPKRTIAELFQFMEHDIKDSVKEMVITTAKALIHNTMHIQETAKELGVHRNTVSFRLEKLQELFGLDPLHRSSDVHILFLLVEYYEHVQQK